MKQYRRAYIDGTWQTFDAVQNLRLQDSFSENELADVALGGPELAAMAVGAARKALETWSLVPALDRARFVRRIGECLEKKVDVLAQEITHEVGMPIKLSRRIQVAGPVAAWSSYSDLADQIKYESKLEHSLLTKEPVGVVVCITPWNYPLHQITAKVAPALIAGCTVVLKPSELAPASAYALAEAIHEAGLPAGVFNLVMGEGAVLGEALVSHPDTDMVSFTGSTIAGRRVSSLAAAMVKRIALELGGKSASVVLPDAELPLAMRHALAACYLNSGQTCTAITRVLVPSNRYEECAELLRNGAAKFTMGDPMAPETRLGPLVSKQQREKVAAYIARAGQAGAELVAGSTIIPKSGFFIAPTVLGNVQPNAEVAQEEIFGPVLTILTYESEQEAVQIANSTRYGLAGAVWSANTDRALQFAKRLRAGQVDVNGAPFNPMAPFGGFKQSGIGRENGAFGISEFLETRSIQLPSS